MKVMGFERWGTVAVARVDLHSDRLVHPRALVATDRSGGLAYPAIALLVAAVAVLVGVSPAD
jgi:hypothetical protein